jgi:acetyl-CoA synthetase
MHDMNQPEERVAAMLSRFSQPQAGAAALLCDGHEPGRVAYTVVSADLSARDLTYGELREQSERLASGLSRLGARSGDRIATLMGKSREYLVTVMAIWRLGAVHVPLFTAFAPPAIGFRLTASRCRFVICDATQRAKLLPGEDLPADAPWKVIMRGGPDSDSMTYDAVLKSGDGHFPAVALGGDAPLIHIYTSGTTGKPKGVAVPLRAVASFQAYAEYGLGVREGDVVWNAADPGWAYGLYLGVLATFATGVRSIFFEGGFTPETTWGVLSRHGVTVFAAAPTVYRALRTSSVPVPPGLKIRTASSAGEPLTPEVNEWAVQALGVPVHDHYGQTEAGMLINNHHGQPLRRAFKPGSMGHSMPGWKAAILKSDADEIAAAGEKGRVAIDLKASPLAWFTGYVEEPAKTAEKFSADGRWYLTGDTGSMDEDGYFFFSSRDDDVIIMAGYRIGPFEVESALSSHPAVAESAVVAAPDEIRGEVIEAFVVLRAQATASEQLKVELQEWVKRKFAAHAYPRRVHFVEALPKTPSGKVQRFVLRDQLRQLRSGAEHQAPMPGGTPASPRSA